MICGHKIYEKKFGIMVTFSFGHSYKKKKASADSGGCSMWPVRVVAPVG